MLTERDHQLDVMTCISINDDILSVTSSVCVHNLFGRADVLPTHRWIVRSMFKRLRRNEIWQTYDHPAINAQRQVRTHK